MTSLFLALFCVFIYRRETCRFLEKRKRSRREKRGRRKARKLEKIKLAREQMLLKEELELEERERALRLVKQAEDNALLLA